MTDSSVSMFVRGLCFYGSRWGFFIRWWEPYFSQVIKLWHICLELRIILIFSWLFHYNWNNSQSCSCRTWSAQRNLSKPWKWIMRCTEKNLSWDFWNGSHMLTSLLHQCTSELLYWSLWEVFHSLASVNGRWIVDSPSTVPQWKCPVSPACSV